MSIQTQIQSVADTLPPAARRVAEFLLADPTRPLSLTISELAKACSTSETSVVRFCRQLGFHGYVELRLALAQEVGKASARYGEAHSYGEDIEPGDSLRELVTKIGASETRGIQDTVENLDLGALELATRAIDSARRVVTFGIGASEAGASDLQHKLFRIGRVAFTFADLHDSLVAAALLGPEDAVVGLSHSGRTGETVEFLKVAAAHGARTIAITNSRDSPLDAAAEITLYTAVRETVFRSGAMASRIAQLTLVDCLFIAVAQRRYDEMVDALRVTHDAVEPFRIGSRRA